MYITQAVLVCRKELGRGVRVSEVLRRELPKYMMSVFGIRFESEHRAKWTTLVKLLPKKHNDVGIVYNILPRNRQNS